jgi:predicted outer membrane protein
VDLDDAAIATVAETISDGQEVRARDAVRLGEDVCVLRFAAHVLANLPGATIATMHVGPRSSVLDDELTLATTAAVGDLDRRRGADFDRTFVASEQRWLVGTLRLLDGTLLPKAANEELAQDLSRMRTAFAEDLRQANALEVALPVSP